MPAMIKMYSLSEHRELLYWNGPIKLQMRVVLWDVIVITLTCFLAFFIVLTEAVKCSVAFLHNVHF